MGDNPMSAIDALLCAARRRIKRVTPHMAYALQQDGALLVDLRPARDRRRDGDIPGALVIERIHLEWRLDPTSPHRVEALTGARHPIVVICNEGYASSLATATLRDLGLVN